MGCVVRITRLYISASCHVFCKWEGDILDIAMVGCGEGMGKYEGKVSYRGVTYDTLNT